MFLAGANLLPLVFLLWRPRKYRKKLIFSAKPWILLGISWFSLSELHSQQPTRLPQGGFVDGFREGCGKMTTSDGDSCAPLSVNYSHKMLWENSLNAAEGGADSHNEFPQLWPPKAAIPTTFH